MTVATAVHDQVAACARPVLVAWPQQADLRVDLAIAGTPCLLVVAPGAPIPVVGEGEDWIYRTAEERDVAARLDQLVRSGRTAGAAPIELPDGLGADAHRVARRLLGSVGHLVARADLPVDDLDATIAHLRRALRTSCWRIQRIGAVGFLIEQDPGPSR